MKYIYFLLASMLLITSCDKVLEDDFLPIEYDAVLSYKTYNEQVVKFVSDGIDIEYDFTILKGGNNPQKESSFKLDVLNQEEIDVYNLERGTKYKLLSDKYYEIIIDNFVLLSSETYKIGRVVFKNSLISSDIGADIDDFVLPIRLSSDLDSVNSDKNLLVLIPQIIIPKVNFQNVDLSRLIFDNVEDKEYTKSFNLELDLDNKWNFNVLFENNNDVLQGLVDLYNTENGSNYQLLPSANYKLSDASFKEGINTSYVDVKINNRNLESNRYLLPIVMNSCSGLSFDVSENINYIEVVVNDKTLEKINLTASMLYTNSEMGDGPVTNLIDGVFDNGNCWHSLWWAPDGMVVTDSIYGIYVDINLESTKLNKAKIVYWTRDINNATPSIMHVYAGTSDDDLTFIEELKNLPGDASVKYESGDLFFEKEISYIRLAFIASSNCPDLRKADWLGQNVAVAELELYGN